MKAKYLLICLLSWCTCWCLSLNAQPIVNYDIYTVNVKTGDVQQVTAMTGSDEYNPSFSKNGKAIVHDVVVASPFTHDLYITDVGSGISTALTGGDGGNDAVWSHHGNLIAFDRLPVGDLSIYTVPAGGGTRTLVRALAIDPDWSVNIDLLAFTDVTDGSVRTVNIFTGVETTIAPFGLNPSWSRNGKAIAFSDGNNLFVVSVNISGQPTGSPAQITFDAPGIFNQQPSWSNNSKTIVFHSNRGGTDFDIWTIPASGGTPALLTGTAGFGDFDPAYSKNSKYVTFAGGSSISPVQQAPVSADVLPTALTIETNTYPNPFSRSTTIRFELPEEVLTSVMIHDPEGKQVVLLVNDLLGAGAHEITWDASNQQPGIYVVHLKADKYWYTGRLVVID